MKKYLIDVGPENVQNCTDNASMMYKVVSTLQEDWPHLYFQGCMAHALNVMLQDWDSPRGTSSMVEDAHKIVKFIIVHHIPQVL